MNRSSSEQRFQTTRWSIVRIAATDGLESSSRRALEELCGLYWAPLYAYLRRTGLSPADSEDTVQGFFTSLLERNDFIQLSPELGRFRAFLLAALKNFLSNQRDRQQAAKRGGGQRFVSLDVQSVEQQLPHAKSRELRPEEVFEHQWALTVLESVREQLRIEYESKGKGPLYAALLPTLTGSSRATYQSLGDTLGMSESAVKMAVSRLRERYRDKLRSEIAQTVSSPEEIEDELRVLVSALQNR